MAHRQFVDTDGSLWQVWDVRPGVARRSVSHVDRALAEGWLCFESGELKRRLAPIPPGWETSSPQELARLCRAAAAVQRRIREGDGAETGPARA